MLVTPPPLPGPHSLVSMSLLVGLPHLCRREASGETLKSQNKVAGQTETVPASQRTVCQAVSEDRRLSEDPVFVNKSLGS